MAHTLQVGAQLWPGGAPDYSTWREAVLRAEDIGADVIFGYDHFHKPFVRKMTSEGPGLFPEQPDVNNFEGWTALASWGEITRRAEIGLLVTGIGSEGMTLFMTEIHPTDQGYDPSPLEELLSWRDSRRSAAREVAGRARGPRMGSQSTEDAP